VCYHFACSLSNLPSRTLASDVQPVHMELLTADGRQVDGPQQLGTSLQLRYTLNGGDGKLPPVYITALVVYDCVAMAIAIIFRM